MKLNSFIKFGSLAFDVASDEKVRELLGLVHNGAKRRGFFDQPQPYHPGHTSQQGTTGHWPKSNQSIPFAPGSNSASKTPTEQSKPKPAPKKQAAEPATPEIPNFGNWLNMDNAKKMMGYASTLNNLLNKK